MVIIKNFDKLLENSTFFNLIISFPYFIPIFSLIVALLCPMHIFKSTFKLFILRNLAYFTCKFFTNFA